MSILKRFARYFGYFLLTLLIIVALWWLAATIRGDDALDAGIEEFYHIDYTGYEKDNGALAMRGLIAPAGEKDSYAWAQKRVAEEIRVQQAESTRNLTLRELAKELAGSNFLRPAEHDTTPYVFYQGDNRIISDCSPTLYFFGREAVHDKKSCAERSKTLEKLIKDNLLMISRYEQALKYGTYFEPNLRMLHGQDMMKLQELMIEQLIEKSKKNREKALKAWLQNMEFYNRAVTGKVDLIQLSILMVNSWLIQRALPSILRGDATLATKYKKKLLAALRPIGANDVQVIYEAKHFYNATAALVKMTDHYNQNKLYRFYKKYIDVWKAPSDTTWKALEEKNGSLSSKFIHWADWRSPVCSILTNSIMAGILVGRDLKTAMGIAATRSNMLAVYVQLTAENTKPENINAFLAQTSASLYDSFTGKPFRYDEKQHMLYFIHPVEGLKDGSKEGVFLFSPPSPH